MPKEYKQPYLPDDPPDSPFTNVNGNWILNRPIMTADFVDGKSGFQLNPTGGFSKINAFGGNVTLYDAVVDASGKGQYRSIQDAVNAGKTRIFVRNGEYAPFSCGFVYLNITGESSAGTIIKMPNGSVNGAHGIYCVASDTSLPVKIEIKNITIDGNSSNQTSGYVQYGIRISGGTYLLDNCIIKSVKGYGFHGSQNGRSVINNCVISYCEENAVYSDSETYIKIVNSILNINEKNGIVLHGSQYCTIQNNNLFFNGQAENNIYSDILLEQSSTYNIVNCNISFAFGSAKIKYGISEENSNCDYNLITNNIIKDAVTAGISVQGAHTIVGDNIA